MKKLYLSLTAMLMAGAMMAENAAMPMDVPGKPNMDASNVQAVMCDFYANNFGFAPNSWGKAAVPDTLGKTNMYYYAQASWDSFTNWGAASYNAAGYAKLHLDVWVSTATPQIKIKIEGLATADGGQGYANSYTYPSGLMSGWNALDIDLATAYSGYDFTDLKYVIFEGLTDETKPMSFANILFYNGNYTADEPEKVERKEKTPEDAPKALMSYEVPAEAQAIIANGFTESLGFASVDWGCPWKEYAVTGGNILYCANMTWEAFTNWGSDSYDLSKYNTLVVELYPAVASNIKVTIEALKEAEGGQEGDFKNGVVKENLVANQWNKLEIPFSEFKYPGDETKSYNFADMKYLILEGYSNEGTMLTIGRVYVCGQAAGIKEVATEQAKAYKRMVNGQMIILRNGVKYNALGAEL